MKNKLLLFIILFGLSGCSEVFSATKSNLSDSCLLSSVDFAYPLYSKKSSESNTDRIYPMKPWEFVSEIPIDNVVNSGFGSIMFMRNMNGLDEIWLKQGNHFAIFQVDANSWEIVNGQIKGANKNPQRIFLDKDDAIWGVGLDGFDYEEIPIFSRFNESKKEFEFIDDNDKTRISNSYFLSEPILDDKGTFWLIINNNQIYNFNPLTNISQLFFDNSLKQLSSLVWAGDEKIFMLSTGLEESALVQFDVKDKSFNKIPILLKSNNSLPFTSLFIDSKDSLWFHDYGWMNQDGNWYQIARSPIFISDRAEYQFQYLWENPEVVFESSNGILWFNSTMGLTLLDPNLGKWCRVTTYPSKIAEDSQGNIWILSYEKLYKYSVNP